MTGAKLAALAAGSVLVDAAASGGGQHWGAVVQQAAATVTGLTVLGGAVWWLIGPRVRVYVRKQSEAAAKVDQVAVALPAASADLGQRLAAVEGELAGVHRQLHDHLVMASNETRLVSELIFRAALDDRPHHTHPQESDQ